MRLWFVPVTQFQCKAPLHSPDYPKNKWAFCFGLKHTNNNLFTWPQKDTGLCAFFQNIQTWKSKDCCPISGSLCLVTVNNLKKKKKKTLIFFNNAFFKETSIINQTDYHIKCQSLPTFVSWSTNFDKLLDLNFHFGWSWLSRSFFCFFGCPPCSEKCM